MAMRMDEMAREVLAKHGDCLGLLETVEVRGVEVLPPAANRLKAFRAVDSHPGGIAGLRVVVLGQDPYYVPGKATGIAFEVSEDGPSFRLRGNLGALGVMNKYMRRVPGSGKARRDLTGIHGVLWMNVALTVLAGEENKECHLDIWMPWAIGFLRKLHEARSDLVYLALGDKAKKVLDGIGIPGTSIVFRMHPSHPAKNSRKQEHREIVQRFREDWPQVDDPRNPFDEIDRILRERGAPPISWSA